jgi:hypothetical protein
VYEPGAKLITAPFEAELMADCTCATVAPVGQLQTKPLPVHWAPAGLGQNIKINPQRQAIRQNVILQLLIQTWL